MIFNTTPKKIPYEIHSFSTHSAAYHPTNIKTNDPSNPLSRWSTSTNDGEQYVIIKLKYPSIVSSVTFGKFSKIHVCNLKVFDVYSYNEWETECFNVESTCTNLCDDSNSDLQSPIKNKECENNSFNEKDETLIGSSKFGCNKKIRDSFKTCVDNFYLDGSSVSSSICSNRKSNKFEKNRSNICSSNRSSNDSGVDIDGKINTSETEYKNDSKSKNSLDKGENKSRKNKAVNFTLRNEKNKSDIDKSESEMKNMEIKENNNNHIKEKIKTEKSIDNGANFYDMIISNATRVCNKNSDNKNGIKYKVNQLKNESDSENKESKKYENRELPSSENSKILLNRCCINHVPFTNTKDNPILVLHDGLRNDTTPETFPTLIVSQNTFIVTRYLKIVPRQAWGMNFNFSIWYLEVNGWSFNKNDIEDFSSSSDVIIKDTENEDLVSNESENIDIKENNPLTETESLRISDRDNLNNIPHINQIDSLRISNRESLYESFHVDERDSMNVYDRDNLDRSINVNNDDFVQINDIENLNNSLIVDDGDSVRIRDRDDLDTNVNSGDSVRINDRENLNHSLTVNDGDSVRICDIDDMDRNVNGDDSNRINDRENLNNSLTVNEGDSVRICNIDDMDININSGDSVRINDRENLNNSLIVNEGDSVRICDIDDMDRNVNGDDSNRINDRENLNNSLTVNEGDSVRICNIDDMDININSGDSVRINDRENLNNSLTVNEGESVRIRDIDNLNHSLIVNEGDSIQINDTENLDPGLNINEGDSVRICDIDNRNHSPIVNEGDSLRIRDREISDINICVNEGDLIRICDGDNINHSITVNEGDSVQISGKENSSNVVNEDNTIKIDNKNIIEKNSTVNISDTASLSNKIIKNSNINDGHKTEKPENSVKVKKKPSKADFTRSDVDKKNKAITIEKETNFVLDNFSSSNKIVLFALNWNNFILTKKCYQSIFQFLKFQNVNGKLSSSIKQLEFETGMIFETGCEKTFKKYIELEDFEGLEDVLVEWVKSKKLDTEESLFFEWVKIENTPKNFSGIDSDSSIDKKAKNVTLRSESSSSTSRDMENKMKISGENQSTGSRNITSNIVKFNMTNTSTVPNRNQRLNTNENTIGSVDLKISNKIDMYTKNAKKIQNSVSDCTKKEDKTDEEPNKLSSWPEERSGQAMISIDNYLYLHGGWNGKEELSEMWRFDCKYELWEKLECGVGKRSCHQLVYVPDIKKISTFGISEIDSTLKPEIKHTMPKTNADVYKTRDKYPILSINSRYTDYDKFGIVFIGQYAKTNSKDKPIDIIFHDLKTNCAYKLNLNIKNELKPVFDCQCVNTGEEIIIFGGKTREECENTYSYSGLYVLKKGMLIEKKEDNSGKSIIGKRVGHSLLYFESKPDNIMLKNTDKGKDEAKSCTKIEGYATKVIYPRKNLFIIGGHNEKKFMQEIRVYDIEKDNVWKIIQFPIKTERKIVNRSILVGEYIYTLFCYEKNKDSGIDKIEIYRYSIYEDKWDKIEFVGDFPKPRVAHSFVYNEVNETFYLFGGNTFKNNIVTDKDILESTRKKIHSIITGFRWRDHDNEIINTDRTSTNIDRTARNSIRSNSTENIDNSIGRDDPNILNNESNGNENRGDANITTGTTTNETEAQKTLRKLKEGGRKLKSGEKMTNELWKIEINKNCEKINKIKYKVRKHKFLRIVSKQEYEEAVEYLQTKIYEVVDHNNKKESIEFKKLCFQLYSDNTYKSDDEITNDICKIFVQGRKDQVKNIWECII